ncbi:MAG TPA: phosphate ABC transporter permease subunit PstC [Candidatus Sulfotelmatobacter sp.]|nr:phosphate ABC transporter permease subunit PstC [Candidatus Sulfotelmatobacter sp.]
MNTDTEQRRRSHGWMGIHRGHKARPVEWLAEKFIFLVSLSTIAMVLLIFLFVAREALPVFFGETNTALIQPVIPTAEMDKHSPAELQQYLELTPEQFKAMDKDTLSMLMDVKVEALNDIPDNFRKDPDAKINTSEWKYLVQPHQWSGYSKPEFIWQPVGEIKKFNIIPLFVGTLKVTLIGLLFAVPLAVGAAIYVSQLARPRMREIVKPAIEMLSGIPSVVAGFFALIVMASVLQKLFGYQTRLNAFVAGIALGFAVIPVIFSIAEDALTSVPRAYTQAALALGASRWQTAWQIVLPAALPGVFAATVLGFGRAIGETMIVLMVCSASVMSWSIFDSARSITTTIAAEMGEVVTGGAHYRILFMLGSLLFAATFLSNMAGELVIQRFKQKLEGKK